MIKPVMVEDIMHKLPFLSLRAPHDYWYARHLAVYSDTAIIRRAVGVVPDATSAQEMGIIRTNKCGSGDRAGKK